MITNQITKIWGEDWRYLIILDACRYDFFAKVYQDYPIIRNGILEKTVSPGSSTLEWFEKTFMNKERMSMFRLVYISANPFINSKKNSIKGHLKVIDVWNLSWNKKFNTVHPVRVNKATLMAIRVFRNVDRYVIHYLQPHFPYRKLSHLNQVFLRELELEKERRSARTLNNRIKGSIRWKLINHFGRLGINLASKVVGPPLSIEYAVARQVGPNELKKAYEDNLRWVLKYVSNLVNKLKGRIVITADHGELLGEFGMYGHFKGIRVPQLVEVPWVIIER